jgi:hypothetical protein
LKCLNHCHNIIKSSKKGSFIWTIAENMRNIVHKNEVSIMKLSARRGLECRILHHLSQTPSRPHQSACYFSIFSCYFKIYWHPCTKIGKQELGIWWVQKRFPRYGVPIWTLSPNIRFLPSIVAEKNATKNEHIYSMCIKINKVGKQEVGICWVQKRFPQYGVPIWSLWRKMCIYVQYV